LTEEAASGSAQDVNAEHVLDHGELAAGDAYLADAGDAFVRIDDDEEKVALATPDGIAFNVGNFHLVPPVGLLGLQRLTIQKLIHAQSETEGAFD